MSLIPETDSPTVAAIAAALHLAEHGKPPTLDLKIKLQNFVDAYEVIAKAAISGDIPGARESLKQLK